MKVEEVKTGMKVVATNSVHATVYTVKTISNHNVELMFAVNGQVINAGVLNVIFLNCPTTEQLINA
jgi:hypothetical protein